MALFPNSGVEPECREDPDCETYEACRDGTCVHVCRPDPCGFNAICKGVNHRYQCDCTDGFIGDPYVHCRRSEYSGICFLSIATHACQILRGMKFELQVTVTIVLVIVVRAII